MSLPLSNKLTIFSVIFVAETAATMVYMTGQGLIKGHDGYIPFQSAPLLIRGSSLRINEDLYKNTVTHPQMSCFQVNMTQLCADATGNYDQGMYIVVQGLDP